MKTASKVWLSLAGGLLVIGLVIAVIGGGIYRLDPKYKLNFAEQNKTFNASTVDTIETDLTNRRIEVIPTNDDTISISYYTNKDDEITCEQNGSTIKLRLKQKRYFRLFSNIDFTLDGYKVYIRVPHEYAGNFDLTTTNSKINIENLNNLSDAIIKSSNGSIHLDNVKAKRVSLKTTNASIKLNDVISDSEIDATTTNSTVFIEGCSAVNEIDTSTTNGSITIDESTAGEIKARSTNASISVEEITADTIDLTSSNGRISGSIIGVQSEYNIDTSTTNGKCSPSSTSNSNATNELSVHTTNATIDLMFK